MKNTKTTQTTEIAQLNQWFLLDEEFLTSSRRSIATSQSIEDFKKKAFSHERNYEETITEGLNPHGGSTTHSSRSWIVDRKIGTHRIMTIYPHNFTTKGFTNHNEGMCPLEDGFKAYTPEALQDVLRIASAMINGKNYQEDLMVLPRFTTINEIVIDHGQMHILGQ